MKVVQIIPVRMGSSRFPGKPLKKILNTPMVELIYRNIEKNNMVKITYVATCDQVIFNYLKSKHINVVLTSNKHQRASDRCAEAFLKIEKKLKVKFDIIVMVQGDEPLITKKNVEQSLKPFIKNKKIKVVNLMSRISDEKELNDINCIKVVTDKNNNALFFSRNSIPSYKIFDNKLKFYKQVCVIPFSRKGIFQYMNLKTTYLEKKESIDMLRFLENDIRVKMIEIKNFTHPIDHPKDIKIVESFLKKEIRKQ